MGKKKGGGVRVKSVGPKMPVMPVNPLEDLQIPASEMVHLPPPPDRNYSIPWPLHQKHSTEGFQVIYPNYLDGSKSAKMGRRLPVSLAVDPSPTVADITAGLQLLRVPHVLQPYKGYPRDPLVLHENPGRVLVDTQNHSKTELMRQLAATLPDLPSRQRRLAAEAAKQQIAAEQQAAAQLEQEKLLEEAKRKAAKKKGKKGKRK